MIQVTNVSQLQNQRDYITKDAMEAALFALHFKGKLTKTPAGNWIVSI